MNLVVREEVRKAISKLSQSSEIEKGEIYTKNEVVSFIFDLLEYKPSRELFTMSLLEPSFGRGDFLKEATERLLKSFIRYGKEENLYESLKNSIRAIELSKNSYDCTKLELVGIFSKYGVTPLIAKKLLKKWLFHSDFLLTRFDISEFDIVVGNPPYIRQELLSELLLSEYRQRYKTIYDRADIYVPFIERSLDLIRGGGKLSFICSDRWIRNKYGGPLRKKISKGFSLKYFIDMKRVDAFLSKVTAYPSVFCIEKKIDKEYTTYVPPLKKISMNSLGELAQDLLNKKNVHSFKNVVCDSRPWLLDCPKSLKALRKIELKFNTIEQEGCKVGIGVATGNDRIYIADHGLGIEESRKLPILLASDIKSGKINYKGKILVNPYGERDLVNLEDFPKLHKYFMKNSHLIKKRYVAKRSKDNWFRTIDKVHHWLTFRPKLLIPDIKGKANIVFDSGSYYPHHNLYYVLSENWELEALQAILKSSIGLFFYRDVLCKDEGRVSKVSSSIFKKNKDS